MEIEFKHALIDETEVTVAVNIIYSRDDSHENAIWDDLVVFNGNDRINLEGLNTDDLSEIKAACDLMTEKSLDSAREDYLDYYEGRGI